MRRLPRYVVLVLTALVSASAAGVWTSHRAVAAEADTAASPIHVSDVADHAYRVIGHANFILFSLTEGDVGGARLTWRRDRGAEKISLLVGSDPGRAPRALNEWAYSFEEVRGDRADAFLVGSMSLGEPAPPTAPNMPPDARDYRVVCSSVAGAAVQSFVTTVRTDRGITYHTIGKVLDHIGGTPQWKPLHGVMPHGAAPGLLTALGRALDGSIQQASNPSWKPVTMPYFYNSALYDLTVRKVRRQANVSVGTQTYPELLRTDFVSVRRRDGDRTPFSVGYALGGPYAGVPVMIAFHPNWWLTVELQLDDGYRVPADPGTDPVLAGRIHDICASATTPRE